MKTGLNINSRPAACAPCLLYYYVCGHIVKDLPSTGSERHKCLHPFWRQHLEQIKIRHFSRLQITSEWRPRRFVETYAPSVKKTSHSVLSIKSPHVEFYRAIKRSRMEIIESSSYCKVLVTPSPSRAIIKQWGFLGRRHRDRTSKIVVRWANGITKYNIVAQGPIKWGLGKFWNLCQGWH